MGKRDIFDSKGKFLPAVLASVAGVNVAVGPDGDFWSYKNGLWSPDPDIVHKACVKHLGNEYTRTRANNVADIVRLRNSTTRIPATPDGANKWYPWINLKNVAYAWQDDEARDHIEMPHSTVQLNVEWDMAATCPLFDAWVGQVIPHDMLELFWEVLGYCLMTGNPKQTAILILGPGGTGKSTFLRVLEYMLGRQNIATESLKSLTENRFSVANLYGKLANIQGDIDAAYMKDSSIFKALTGGDTMNAEYKGKTAFSFEPFATPIFSANKVWRSSDDTDGYFRRWTILPFLRKVDRSKPFDEEALYREASGIFNKAMGALRDMYERTEPKQLTTGEVVYESSREFSSSRSAREALAQFQQDSDPLRMWLADDDRVTHEVGSETMRTDRTTVYKTYQNWCYANSVNPKAAPEFYKSMTALGHPTRKSGNARFILGVTVTLADADVFV